VAGIGRRSRSRRDYTADVTQTLVPQPQDCDALQRGAEPPHGESPHGPSFSFPDFAGAGQFFGSRLLLAIGCRPSSTAARTPATEFQGFVAEEVSDDQTYVSVTCIMCRQIHLVNPSKQLDVIAAAAQAQRQVRRTAGRASFGSVVASRDRTRSAPLNSLSGSATVSARVSRRDRTQIQDRATCAVLSQRKGALTARRGTRDLPDHKTTAPGRGW
jgi:hypothetical protein